MKKLIKTFAMIHSAFIATSLTHHATLCAQSNEQIETVVDQRELDQLATPSAGAVNNDALTPDERDDDLKKSATVGKDDVVTPYLQVKNSDVKISTLGDALAAAYANNSTLQQARRNVMVGHEKIAQAKAGFLPRLRSEVGVSGKKAQTSGSAKDTSDTTPSRQRTGSRYGEISFSQNLFAGGSTIAQVQSTDQSIRGAWADLLSTEQRVFLAVIRGYAELSSKISEVEVQKANYDAMKKSYESASGKHKVGEEALTQVANAQAKLSDAEAKYESTKAAVIAAKASLAAILGIEPGDIKKPQAPKDLPDSLEKVIQLSCDNNPDVIKAQYEHKSAEAGIDQIHGKFLPSVDLKATSRRDEDSQRNIYSADSNGIQRFSSSKNSNYRTNNSVQLSMSYDIYSGGAYSSQRRAAHDTVIAKRIAIEGAKSRIASDVKGAFENYQAAKRNIKSYQSQVNSMKTALESTRQEVEVGTKVLLDYLNAQSEFVRAQLNLIDAEKRYLQSSYQMVQLLGGLHARAMKLNVEYFDPQIHYNNITIGF